MIKKRRIKILIAGLVFVALTAAAGFAYMLFQLSRINYVELPKTNSELGITDAQTVNADGTASEELTKELEENSNPNVINIALFGVGTNPNNEAYNSDTIIILSIDKERNKIKLSSVLRDTYAYVEGLGMTKINYAYAKGGPALALKTLNSNFNLNIKDYVTVDFEGYKEIIDSLGGVEITVKDYEVPAMQVVGISSSGTYILDGEEALRYSRTRSVGYADYERTDRQRIVMTKVFEKIIASGVTRYPALVSALLPYTETSLSTSDIIGLGTSIFMAKMDTIEQARFPAAGYTEGEMIGDLYYEVNDLKVTAAQIHDFIYDDEYPDAVQ